MVKAFKESHAKDLEKLAVDRLREAENKATDDLANTPKHPVLSMIWHTSPLWSLGMFQMVTGESCQCIRRTKQTNPLRPEMMKGILKVRTQMVESMYRYFDSKRFQVRDDERNSEG